MKGYKLALIFVAITVIYAIIKLETAERKYEEYMQLNMQIYVERIENTVIRSIDTGILLESIIRNLEPSFNENTYNYVARDLFNEKTMISISYMPDGIVKWIYPQTEDNLNVLGLNVFEFEGTKDGAYKSKRNGKFMISGPLELKSGQMGLTVRTPIYLSDNTFWGFVSVVFDSLEIANAALEVKNLDNLGYKYAIHSSYNDEKIALLVSDNFDYEKAFYSQLQIPGNTWDFFLYDKDHDKDMFSLLLTSLVEALGICALLFTIIALVKKRQNSIYDQVYRDPLTKLYNRKKLDTFLDDKKTAPTKVFTLFYMDLNKFKPVNDTYGHLIGDKLLITFSERLRQRFDKSTIHMRLGGDEFALIVNSELDEANIQRVIQRIITLAEEPFYIDELEIHISTSVGYARYQKEGSTMAEIIDKADVRMYDHKQKQRKQS